MTTLLILALTGTISATEPAPMTLDDGTWIRKSISVLPVALAPCQKTPDKELRSEWKQSHPKKNPSKEDILALSRRNAEVCEDVRRNLDERADRFTEITHLHRFDHNPLEQGAEDRLRRELEHEGFRGRFEKALQRELGVPLVEILDRTALERAKSLESDFQKNSMVTEKTKTEDITANQTALVRKAAYLFALRIDGLRVSRTKAGWTVHARRQLEIWKFDPARRIFTPRASWDDAVGGKAFPDPEALASQVWTNSGFDSRILALDEFRFTAQFEEVVEKGWRPAAVIHANTDADLRVHRRFLYLENRLVPGHGSVRESVGWGYLDQANTADSSYRIRHIGGQDPYDGLVVEEVPGTSWQILSFSLVPGRSDNQPASVSGASVRFSPESEMGVELRLGTRGNLPGDWPNQNLLIDLALQSQPVSAWLEQGTPRPVEQSGTWMLGMGAEVGWTVRYPIRRLALTGGAGFGGRWQMLPLHPAYYLTSASENVPSTPPHSFARLDRTQAWLGLRAGAQWSLSVSNGIGAEIGWEAWRSPGTWSTGGSGSSQEVSGGTHAGPGPWRLSLQWIFG